MNKELHNEDKKYYISFISFSLTAIVLLAVGYVLSFIKNELEVKYILETYNISLDHFVSERSEKIQYIVLTLLFPFVFIIFYKLVDKLADKIKIGISNINAYLRLTASVIAIIGFNAINLMQPFYFSETILVKAPLTFLSFSVILLGFIYFYESCNSNIKHVINRVLLCIGIAGVFFTAGSFITKDYYFSLSGAHHFDAYFYPVYKVFSGQTILVDFNCLYGFYPYLLVPILRLLGGVNMYSFSIIMAILVVVIFLSIFASMWRLCCNKIVALLGFLSIMFFICLFPMTYNEGSWYLQYLPHRMLFPAIFVLICTVYIYLTDNKKKKIVQITGYIVTCLSLLWNIDTGIILIATWCIFFIFLQLLEYELNKKQLYVQSLKYIVFAMATVIVAYIILACITFVRAGSILRLQDTMSSQRTFYESGFFMLRMPLVHQWIILISVYAIGLSKALKNIAFLRRSKLEYPKIRTKMYFVLSVLGMGLFSYYQGRSHDNVFTVVTCPAIMLFVLFVDEGIAKIKTYYSNYTHRTTEIRLDSCTHLVKGIFGILILACFSLSYIYNIQNNQILRISEDKKYNIEDNLARNAVNFIKEIRKGNQPIDLIMLHSAAVYSILGEKSAANVPATVDWYTKEDYKKVIAWIRKTENKIVFDSYSYNLLNTYNYQELKEILSSKFILLKNTNDYLYFIPIDF